MKPAWTQEARERAYTHLCDAITAAGPEREADFLARLCLLLVEELSDPAAFERALAAARLADRPVSPSGNQAVR
jgi:hypothetical protein